MIRTPKILAVMSCCFVLVLGSLANAGVLNGHALAYNDGLGPQGDGSWSGTAAYANDGLNGTVDWAVFTDDDFSSLFTGYTPTPGGLVYTYQLFSNGNLNASGMDIFLDGFPADNGGSFSGSGVSGSNVHSAFADAFTASYGFDGVNFGAATEGMAFSSPQRPQLTGVASIINGGTPADAAFLSIPGPVAIPEPASWLIASIVTVCMLVFRRSRCG